MAASIDLAGSNTGAHRSIAVGIVPAHGTGSVGGDVVTYTPAAGYYGADSFTYMATGPGGTSAPATVSLTVGTPPAPTAGDKSGVAVAYGTATRSEEHTSELQSLMRISYAVFCLKKKKKRTHVQNNADHPTKSMKELP